MSKLTITISKDRNDSSEITALGILIQQIGERATKGVSDIMQTEGDNIKELAIGYAPVDEGNLEKAIKKNTEYTGVNGRAVVEVYVDAGVAAPKKNLDGTTYTNGRTVGDYLNFIHEGTYNLGEKSETKQAYTGYTVGRKFLERAFEDRKEIFLKKASDRIKRAANEI